MYDGYPKIDEGSESTSQEILAFPSSIACDTSDDTSDNVEEIDFESEIRNPIPQLKTVLTTTPLGHPDLHMPLASLATAYSTLYGWFESENDRNAAIIYGAAELVSFPIQDMPSDISERQEKLAGLYLERYEELGEVEDIQAAIHQYKASVYTTPDANPELPDRLWALHVAYIHRYHSLHQVADFNSALSTLKVVTANTHLGHPALSARLRNLSILHEDRYRRIGHLSDIQTAVIYGQAAATCAAKDDPDYTSSLLVLADVYATLYQRLGGLDNLEKALELRGDVVKQTPSDDPKYPSHQEDLGVSYTQRYQRLGELKDLETALHLKKQSVIAALLGDPDLPGRLRNLAVSFTDRFQRLATTEDLEAAFICGRAAVESTPSGHSALLSRLQSLSATHVDRYQLFGNLEDLEAALKYDKNVVDATPPEDPELAGRQRSLAVTYADRYQRLGEPEDLESSIYYGKSAIENTHPSHADYASRNRSLAASYVDRYQRLGLLSDIGAAISYSRSALDSMPLDHPDYAICETNLAISYIHRYRGTGDMADLENALQWCQAAIAHTPKGHSDLPARQKSLAEIYADRYQRFGETSDLEIALELKKHALEGLPDGSRDIPEFQAKLASSYLDRYRKLRESTDLDSALDLNDAAVRATNRGDVDFSIRHQSLAEVYLERHKDQGRVEDLKSAIQHDRIAVATTPAGHTDLPSLQHNLAMSCCTCYRNIGRWEDLQEALEYSEAALGNCPAESPKLPAFQQGLAYVYQTLYENSLNENYRAKSLHYSTLSLKSSRALPDVVWHAAIYMAELHTKANLPEALDGYKLAFSMIPHLLWIGSSLTARHDNLVRNDIQSVTSSAVAAALQFNQPSTAAEFLEQGLSITHQQTLQLKDENSALWLQHPNEAAKLKALSTQLSYAGQATVTGRSRSVNHNSLAVERDQLIQKIRAFEGFHDFLVPSPYTSLSYAAEKGPIVLLSSTTTRSDAVIILAPLIAAKHIPLPLFSSARADQELQKMRSILKRYSISLNRYGRPSGGPRTADPISEFNHILSWLGNSVITPVFEELRKNGVSGGRVWWCTSGAFSAMPIHAAAPLSAPYIPSYTSTLGALVKARNRIKSAPGISGSLTMIGVGEIPGRPELRLQMVQSELQKVKAIWGGSRQPIVELLDSNATVQNVLREIEAASWLHLACHGQQDANPLESGLLLSDGKLELATILDRTLPHARLVFLSACETAMGDAQLVNESMHLAGGFIVAGFQGAVGTLWSMGDAEGPTVAEAVYKKVFSGRGEADVTLAAEGLHHGIRKLREGGSPPHRWVPFVHFGI